MGAKIKSGKTSRWLSLPPPVPLAVGATGPAGAVGPYSPFMPLDPEPRPVDQRLTSFLERYLIERVGACKGENPLQEGWLIIQDGKKLYRMIQEQGSKGVS